MQTLTPMFGSGVKYTLPADKVDSFRQDFGDQAEDGVSLRTKDGQSYTIPRSQAEAFKADFPDAQEVSTFKMADGTTRQMTVPETMRFLRSPEYRASADYAERRKALDEQIGSPVWAGVKGFASGMVEGANAGGNASANAMTKSIPEIGVGLERAFGNVLNVGGKFRNPVGDWFVRDAEGAKNWLDAKLPSQAKAYTGYEDWSTKASDKVGEVAAMAYKFAPAMATGGTSLGSAMMETIFATDGVNAASDTYQSAKANGYGDADAGKAAAASFLVNYYGGKAFTKAGMTGGMNPVLAFLGRGAEMGNIVGLQAAANKGIENLTAGKDGQPAPKPFTDGMWDAYTEGQFEGNLMHYMNAVPGAVMQGEAALRARLSEREMRRESLLTAAETPEGAELLDTLLGGEKLDAAIAARDGGESISRKVGKGLDFPGNMSAEERNAVVDAIAVARKERARVEELKAWKAEEEKQKIAEERRAAEAEMEAEGHKSASLKGMDERAARKAEMEEYERAEAERKAREKAEEAGALEVGQEAALEEAKQAKAREAVEAETNAAPQSRTEEYPEYATWLKHNFRADTDKNWNRFVAENGLDPALKVERGREAKPGKVKAEEAKPAAEKPIVETPVAEKPADVVAERPVESPVENTTKKTYSRDDIHSAHYGVTDAMQNIEQSGLTQTQIREYNEKLNEARRVREETLKGVSTEDLLADFNEQFGGHPPSRNKGWLDYFGKYQSNLAAALQKEIETRGYTYNRKTGFFDKNSEAPVAKVPDGKGRMVKEETESQTPIIATTSAAKKALGKGKSGYSIEGTKESFEKAVDSVREEIESLKDDGKSVDFVTKDGKYHIAITKGKVLDHETNKYVPAWHLDYTDSRNGLGGGGGAESDISEAIRWIKSAGANVIAKTPTATPPAASAPKKVESTAPTAAKPAEPAQRVSDGKGRMKKYYEANIDVPRTPESEIADRTSMHRLDPRLRSEPAVLAWAKKRGRVVDNGMVTADARREYDREQAMGAAKLSRNWFPDMKVTYHDYGENVKRGQHVLDQKSGIYTGSSAEYEKPSLVHVGSGEGSQVYGWGLYGSTVRGVAEWYAKNLSGGNDSNRAEGEIYISGNRTRMTDAAERQIHQHGGVVGAKEYISGKINDNRVIDSEKKQWRGVLDEILNAEKEGRISEHHNPLGNVYSQTFFTNRAPGDESHLLNWYEPIGERMAIWIASQIRREGLEKIKNASMKEVEFGSLDGVKDATLDQISKMTGEQVYEILSRQLGGSPRAASEFLSRAEIDGIKYPVDSYGGKTIKDGDKAGWNYVSFRDDNITVDHKWSDGRQLFLRDRAGNTLGWFDPNNKEVHLLPGANAETVAHEIMWHGTRDWAKTEAAKGNAEATRLLNKMHEVENACPASLKRAILRAYRKTGVTDPDALLNEFGAWDAMVNGGKALGKELQKRENAVWYARWWNAAKDLVKSYLARHGKNRVDFSDIDGMTTDEFKDFLAAQFAGGKTLGEIVPKAGKTVSTDETKFQKARRVVYDVNASIRDLERDIEKAHGVKIKFDESAEAANALTPGLREAELLATGATEREYREILDAGKLSNADVEAYMGAKAAAGRDAKVNAKNLAQIAKDVERDLRAEWGTDKIAKDTAAFDAELQNRVAAAQAAYNSTNGSHIDPREARVTVREAETGSHAADYANARAKLRAVMDETLQVQKDAGLISEELYNKLKAEEPDYVPFKNEYDLETGEAYGRGVNNFTKPEFYEARGRQSAAGDIVAHIFQDNLSAKHRAIENGVREKLARLVERFPELGTVEKVGEAWKEKQKQLSDRKDKANQTGDPNVVMFKRNGDTYAIRLNGTRGAAIAAGITERNVMRFSDLLGDKVGDKLDKFSRFQAGLATRYAPFFAFRNLPKDNIELGNIVLSERGLLEGSRWIKDYVASYKETAGALSKFVMTGKVDASTPGGRVLHRYIDAGGLISGGGTEGYDAQSIRKRMDPKFIEKEMKRGRSKTYATLQYAKRGLGYLSEMSELITRVNAFNAELKAGKSDGEAALFSRRATVDFNRHGEMTGVTNVLRLFSNSTLGATARATAALANSKGGRAMAAILFANGVARVALEHLMNDEDDKGREAAGTGTGKDVPEYERQTSLFYVRNGDKILKIAEHESPFSVITYAGDTLARVLYGDISVGQAAKNLGVSTAEVAFHLTCLGSLNLTSREGGLESDSKAALVSLAPSLVQPAVEVITGIDYKGDPIAMQLFDQTDVRSHHPRANTPDYQVKTAQFLNWITGGNAGRRGYADLSPEAVGKLIEGYGKNALREGLMAYDLAKAMLGDKKWSDIDVGQKPLVRDWVRPIRGNTNRYYDAKQTRKEDRKEFDANQSSMSIAERYAYAIAHPASVGPKSEGVSKLEDSIQKLQKMERGFVYRNGKAVPHEWGEEKLKEFEKRRLELQARYLKLMETPKK